MVRIDENTSSATSFARANVSCISFDNFCNHKNQKTHSDAHWTSAVLKKVDRKDITQNCLEMTTLFTNSFTKHKWHAGHWKGRKCSFLSQVTLTFDLYLQTRPSEGPNTSSMWIWRKSVQWFPRYFIHKQEKHSDRWRQKQNLLQLSTTRNLVTTNRSYISSRG